MINDEYIGTGSFKNFVKSCVELFSAFNNAEVRMPDGYEGEPPRLYIDDGSEASLILDMSQALVFSLNNIKWEFSGSATVNTYGAYVKDGTLHLKVNASGTA